MKSQPENREAQEPAAPFSINPKSSMFFFPEYKNDDMKRDILLDFTALSPTSHSGHKLLRLTQSCEEDAVLADVGDQGGRGASIEAPPYTLTGQGGPRC